MPDDFDTVVADRCSAVDDVPVPADLWSRVQFKVLDHMPAQFPQEETTMIDLEAPSQTEEHRKGPKRFVVAGLLAAAAVVAIAVVAIYNGDPDSPADQPSPTVTVPPTMPPQALFGAPEEQLMPPGTYFLDEVGGTATPRIFLTLGEGWRNIGTGVGIGNDELGVVRFSRPEGVFADACHASEGYHQGSVTTLDGVVAALSEQAGWAAVTAPSDITVNGYPGKTFQRTAPADFTGCNPGDAQFRSSSGWWYEPNEIETLLVLDVNGSIIEIHTRLKPDHNDADAVAGLAAVLDSIRIADA